VAAARNVSGLGPLA